MLGRGEIFSIAQMAAADAAAIASGVAGLELMENAGAAVAEAVGQRFMPAPTIVLCGPGNNGVSFIVARRLARAGWPVRVAFLGRRERIGGDAARRRCLDRRYRRTRAGGSGGCGLGRRRPVRSGLARPLDGVARTTIEAVAASALPVVAVDIPSGVDGDTGQVLGAAAPARLTVTFHRFKPGHLLLPGAGAWASWSSPI